MSPKLLMGHKLKNLRLGQFGLTWLVGPLWLELVDRVGLFVIQCKDCTIKSDVHPQEGGRRSQTPCLYAYIAM